MTKLIVIHPATVTSPALHEVVNAQGFASHLMSMPDDFELAIRGDDIILERPKGPSLTRDEEEMIDRAFPELDPQSYVFFEPERIPLLERHDRIVPEDERIPWTIIRGQPLIALGANGTHIVDMFGPEQFKAVLFARLEREINEAQNG